MIQKNYQKFDIHYALYALKERFIIERKFWSIFKNLKSNQPLYSLNNFRQITKTWIHWNNHFMFPVDHQNYYDFDHKTNTLLKRLRHVKS